MCADSEGRRTHYSRDSAGRLLTITNPFGRSLLLAYDAAGRIASVSAPGARVVTYGYDAAGRLVSVRHPDGRSRGFVYENAAFPNALTGLVDENGARFASFTYDAQGRAVSTELAGAAERYEVAYPASGQAIVTDPLSTRRTFGYTTTAGQLAVTSGSLASGTHGADQEAASRAQDAQGLTTREVDFQGVVTTTTWDTARRLPLVVTRAAGTPQAMATAIEWHTTFALPSRVTDPARITSYTYDAQGRVLSRTESPNGRAVSPAPAAPAAQVRRWTYDASGLVATEIAPNGAIRPPPSSATRSVVGPSSPMPMVSARPCATTSRALPTTPAAHPLRASASFRRSPTARAPRSTNETPSAASCARPRSWPTARATC